MSNEFFCHHCLKHRKLIMLDNENSKPTHKICLPCSEAKQKRMATPQQPDKKIRGSRAYKTPSQLNYLLFDCGVPRETIRVTKNNE